MRAITTIAAFLLWPALGFSQNAKPTLELAAEVYQGKVAAMTGKGLQVKIVNTGKAPVSIITSNLRLRAETGANKKLTLALDLEKKLDGKRLVVPAESSLAIVKLLPGEVAVFTVSTNAVRRQTNAVAATEKIRVSYEVSEFWGKRFGVWHGKIEAASPVSKE